MQVTEVGYEQVATLKPYETMRISVKVAVNPGESEKQALDKAREFVNTGLKECFDSFHKPKDKPVSQPIPQARPLGGTPNF